MAPTSRNTTGTDDPEGGRHPSPPPSPTPHDPRHYLAEERLVDGRKLVLRAIRPEDKESLRMGFQRLSERSIYHRFFQAKKALTEQELRYFTELDFDNHVGLLAMLTENEEERGVGVGRFIVEPGTGAAEIAFVVDDSHQGQGIGTLLLRHLARIGRAQGVASFHAYVLFDNRQMLEVFDNAGFPVERTLQGNVIRVTLTL
jgi:GNAT superfamily N-acetyltransferase